MLSAVKLKQASLYSAQGADWLRLWHALGQPQQPAAWPFEQSTPALVSGAFAVAEPSLAELGVERKLARTMEKQARMALLTARCSLQQRPLTAEQTQATGLYLGLASIDEEVPTWSALEQIQHNPRLNQAEVFMAESPPFSGLSLLNSSSCAHIAATLGLMGNMAAFSPFADAGLQALLEGVLSVAEGENERALIGAVSPKLHPLLPLHYEAQGWLNSNPSSNLVPGEASAFVLAEAATEGVALVGYARGFILAPEHATATWQRLLQQSISMAGIDPSLIGWIFPATSWQQSDEQAQLDALSQVLQCPVADLPLARTEATTGATGPAQALINLGLALTGLEQQQRWLWQDNQKCHQHQVNTAPAVLLLSQGAHGQAVVALLLRISAQVEGSQPV